MKPCESHKLNITMKRKARRSSPTSPKKKTKKMAKLIPPPVRTYVRMTDGTGKSHQQKIRNFRIFFKIFSRKNIKYF